MQATSTKYMVTETISSAVFNAVLNLAGAFAVFHGRAHIPTTGHGGLVQDTIGETFLVVFLSVLIPSLLTRQRRRAGTVQAFSGTMQPAKPGNLYLRSLVVGVLVTCICVACNAVVLPRIFPGGLSFHHILLFKTVYGTALGCLATALAIRAVLKEELE